MNSDRCSLTMFEIGNMFAKKSIEGLCKNGMGRRHAFMSIREINDKPIWEEFVTTQEERTFLNSWDWGEFQKIMGRKIWRFGAFDGEKLVGAALVSKVKAKRGAHLLIQHGPILATRENPKSKIQILKSLVEELKHIGREEGVSFIRINPLWEASGEQVKLLKDLGFRQAPMHANAYEATWKIDLRASEEELFYNMRKTTRYLIRQTLKNTDIKIAKSGALDDVKIFHALNEEVSQKQKFIPFPKKFIENEFQVFSKDNNALWIFGKYKGEPVAASLIIFWSGIAFYHQAASSPRFAKFSIPYLVQWEAIKEAKRRGCAWYDFWGFTDPQTHPSHPWAGPTLFKMGFGGEKREYVKTQDLPLNWKYWVNFAVEKFRAKRRGY